MIFGVSYSLELHVPISFYIMNVLSYQVKMLILYSVQTTNPTIVGKTMRCTVDNYSIA